MPHCRSLLHLEEALFFYDFIGSEVSGKEKNSEQKSLIFNMFIVFCWSIIYI